MSKRKNCSSSSDDDDLIEAFKEATDTQFLKEDMFQESRKSEPSTTSQQTIPLISLRRNLDCIEQENEFGVSQHFMDFVATRLSRTLDRTVEETDQQSSTAKEKQKEEHQESLGVKLLRSSKVILTEVATEEQLGLKSPKKRRIKKETREEAMTNKSRVAEAAVDPNWILSCASTKAWADKKKGTLYEYKKLNSGILVESSNKDI